MTDLAPGSMVGGYRVERRIGEGGMGAVYAVVHPVIGKRAAAKVIHDSAIGEPNAIERFIQEARVVNEIRHPNLVDVFGFGSTADGRPVLFMELLEGETLRSLLERHGRFDARDAVALLAGALDGIGAAHRAGVVHRDLKPENLFVVTSADGTRALKVLDFGIAKLVEPRPGAEPITGGDLAIGTPAYMSPEQCRAGTLDGRSDLYAMGIILFELLSGGRPFDAESAAEYVGQHLYVRPPSVGELAPTIDARLVAIVSSLLAKDAADRPATAEALSHAFRELHLGPAPRATGADPTLAAGVGAASAPPRTPQGWSAVTVGVTPLSVPSQENRLCSVMMVEVVGLADRTSTPEELKDAADRCTSAVALRIEEHGGWIQRTAGESILAVFGVPRSTENDAERAVLAALDLGRVAERSLGGREAASGVSLVVGIETGIVFTGRGVRERSLAGQPVTVATALAAAAEPGAIVIGRGAHRHVAGLFALEPGPAARARGSAKATEGYLVKGRRRGGFDDDAHEFYGAKTSLIGRRADLTRILEALDHVVDERRAQVVTVSGPAGVGKSRLLDAVRAHAKVADETVFVVAGRAGREPLGGAYGLVIDLVRSRFRVHRDDPRDVVENKLRVGLRWIAGFRPPRMSQIPSATGQPTLPRRAQPELDPADAESAIRVLIDLLAPPPNEEAPASQDSSLASSRVAAAFAQLVGVVATKIPVLVLADSLEAADDASLDLLDYVVTRLRDAPLLVIGATRPELFDDRPHWGEGHAAHSRLVIEPLARRNAVLLARELLSRVTSVSDSFVGELVSRAEGNPRVLEETVRMLVDAGVVDRSSDPWTVHEDRLGAIDLPPTIQGIVQARLDRLADQERALLLRAAVVGRTFWRGALEAMHAREAGAGAASGWLDGALEALRARDLIRARETSTLPGEREYVFSEGATAEVAYSALGKRDLEQHHRDVALWLEGRGSVLAEANPALLAHHHERAGDPASALPYHTRAARHASAMGRNAEALLHYERACAILSTVPPPTSGDTEPSADRAEAEWRDRVVVRVEFGDTQRKLGRLDDAARTYEAVREWVTNRESKSELTDWADATLDFRLGLLEKARGAPALALERYRLALDCLGDDGNAALRAELLVEIGFAHSQMGELDECLAHCRRGLAVCQTAGDTPSLRAVVPRLLYTMGSVFYRKKQLVQAERFYRQGRRIARSMGDAPAESIALNNLAAVAFERNDPATARDLFLESLARKERGGELWDLAVAHNNLSEVARALGDAGAALDQAERALEFTLTLGEGPDAADVRRNLALALLGVGRPSEALEHGLRAFALASDPSGRFYLGPCAIALAKAAVAARAESDAQRVEQVRALLAGEGRTALVDAGLTEVAERISALLAEL